MFFRLLMVILIASTILGTTGASVASAHVSNDHDDDEEASCWISASPSDIYEGGSTTLYWGSSNADDAWIEDIGDVPTQGSRVVYNIDENTTFKLTVENEHGTNSCETDVDVDSYGHHYSSKAPGCNIWRENTYGSGVILRWNTTEASSAYLSGVGAVSAYGQYTVYPTYNTTYTLTVYGYSGKTNSCEIEIDHGYGYGPYYPGYTYPQYPQYQQYPQNYFGGYSYANPYLSLTQIPYTGFDFGTVGSAVYFLALALFAISGAYLLAYYQGGVLRFSFAQEVKAAARNQMRSVARLFSK